MAFLGSVFAFLAAYLFYKMLKCFSDAINQFEKMLKDVSMSIQITTSDKQDKKAKRITVRESKPV